MLDIQRRHAPVFRLRLGEKDRSGRPVKLSGAIKVTSPGESIVQAFVDEFGGEVETFDEATSKDAYAAILPVTEIPIMVLPGQSIEQWWESYRKSVCERRCDGEVEQLSGKACSCPADIAQRMKTKGACRPMTRLNVLCPDVAVVGAGSLVTHGLIAAETLPQSIAVAEAALSRGLMVPGVLRSIEHKGRNHYVIPQVEIVGVSLRMLSTGEVPDGLAQGQRPQLAPPAPAAIGSGEQESGAATHVDEVAPQPADEPERKRPASSARKTAEPRRPAAAPALPGEEEAAEPAAPPAQEPIDVASQPFTEENETLAGLDFSKKFGQACRDEGLTDAEKRNLIGRATDGRTFTTKGLLKTEIPTLREEFKQFVAQRASEQNQETA